MTGVDRVVLAQRDLAAAEQVEDADAEQVLLGERVRRGAVGRERMGPPGVVEAIIAALA